MSTPDNHYIRLRAVADLLDTLPKEDSSREGLQATPDRVARAWDEFFCGYDQDPKEILGTTFNREEYHGIVLEGPIPFYSHCEHHVVPFFGEAWVGYIPEGRLVGLSKLARLVDCFSRRLQIQERLTDQIADALQDIIEPMATGVVIRAEHMCMSMRGVAKAGTKTITSAVRGTFADEAASRAEFMSLITWGR